MRASASQAARRLRKGVIRRFLNAAIRILYCMCTRTRDTNYNNLRGITVRPCVRAHRERAAKRQIDRLHATYDD